MTRDEVPPALAIAALVASGVAGLSSRWMLAWGVLLVAFGVFAWWSLRQIRRHDEAIKQIRADMEWADAADAVARDPDDPDGL